MALNPEFGKSLDSIPHINLRSETTVKKLIKQGRTPFLLASDGFEMLDRAVCFIPPSKTKPAVTFELSLEEARKIAVIRDKLQHQH